MNTHPTHRTYTGLDAAYDHFNRELFAGTLPSCLITMQRHKGAYGYFSGERFARLASPEEVTDEIALNPATFATRTPTAILSTLAHEMCHLWQHHRGKPSRNGYHNKEWAAKMREVGLIPTATGQPGGKDTGQGVTHIIDPGGRFETACTAYLATAPAILYHDREGDAVTVRKTKAASKTKYTCPGCAVNVWGKPGLAIVCGVCGRPFASEEGVEPPAAGLAVNGRGTSSLPSDDERHEALQGPIQLKDPNSFEFAYQQLYWIKVLYSSWNSSLRQWKDAVEKADEFRIYDRLPDPSHPYGSLDAMLQAELGFTRDDVRFPEPAPPP
jgi:hypothetical protein